MFPRNSEQEHFAAITDPVEVGRLLRAIDHYAGDFDFVRLEIITTGHVATQ
ncbi:MAG: hypothetical protein R3E89_06970 [Thiolinea sp.]